MLERRVTLSDRLNGVDDWWRRGRLADVLTAMRVGWPDAALTEADAPWGLRFDHVVGAAFHVVLQGTCWLTPIEGSGFAPVELGQGDVVLLGRGAPHALVSANGVPLTDFTPTRDAPGNPTTARVLAAVAGLSCAAFARRFATLVGEPPLTYLSRWRMTIAARLLRDTDKPSRRSRRPSGTASPLPRPFGGSTRPRRATTGPPHRSEPATRWHSRAPGRRGDTGRSTSRTAGRTCGFCAGDGPQPVRAGGRRALA